MIITLHSMIIKIIIILLLTKNWFITMPHSRSWHKNHTMNEKSMASLLNEKTHYTQLRQSMVSHETSFTNNELYGSKLKNQKHTQNYGNRWFHFVKMFSFRKKNNKSMVSFGKTNQTSMVSYENHIKANAKSMVSYKNQNMNSVCLRITKDN